MTDQRKCVKLYLSGEVDITLEIKQRKLRNTVYLNYFT